MNSSLLRFPSGGFRAFSSFVRVAAVSSTFFVFSARAQTPEKPETPLERAIALDEGTRVTRDPAAAAEFYRSAAASGDAFAHLRLGYLTETGDGVPQDYAAARAHYQTAVDAGLTAARLRLAICHLEGWGGPVDRPAFVREILTAAEAGNAEAAQIMGSLYLIGFAVPENREEGLKWTQRAAAKENANAQFTLGRVMEAKRRQALMPDAKLARSWYQLSAEQEYRAGMRALARTFLTGSRAERNWEMGHRWLELATENGDDEAPYLLAICELRHVDSPTHDVDRARAWLQLASERRNACATEVLQLELSGRTLNDAVSYVLNVPFEDRYVERMAAAAGNESTRRPVPIRVVKPIYPQSLRIVEVTGEVLVDFIVDTTGRVQNAKAVKSTHPLFSERAIEAMQQWRFHPGRIEGRLVNTHLQVPISFTLNWEQLRGIDSLFHSARDLAAKLGPSVEADAVDLRPAIRKTAGVNPVMPDGSAPPNDVLLLLLLVLDPTGRPVRGHILKAEPLEAGPAFLASALTQTFAPRLVNNEAVSSNVILPHVSGRFVKTAFKASDVATPGR